jgi:hypothetical protein
MEMRALDPADSLLAKGAACDIVELDHVRTLLEPTRDLFEVHRSHPQLLDSCRTQNIS